MTPDADFVCDVGGGGGCDDDVKENDGDGIKYR